MPSLSDWVAPACVPACCSDITGLAASLVREALPGHFQVSTASSPKGSWGSFRSEIAVHVH